MNKEEVNDMELWTKVTPFLKCFNTVLVMPFMSLKCIKLLCHLENESGFISLI